MLVADVVYRVLLFVLMVVVVCPRVIVRCPCVSSLVYGCCVQLLLFVGASCALFATCCRCMCFVMFFFLFLLGVACRALVLCVVCGLLCAWCASAVSCLFSNDCCLLGVVCVLCAACALLLLVVCRVLPVLFVAG